MSTPRAPTVTMAMGSATKKLRCGMATIRPKMLMDSEVIMMQTKAPSMKSSPNAKLMSSMMP